MAFFVEEVIGKIDSKGRTSLPAPYRSELEGSEFFGIVVFKSLEDNCYIGSDIEYLKNLFDRVAEEHGPFSRQMKIFRREVVSKSKRLSVDADGRIVIPQAIRSQLGIDKQLVYSGGGDFFEIWSAESFAKAHDSDASEALEVLNGLPARKQSVTMNDLFGGGDA
ncbi:hypothetical protein QGN29_08435 [Temperatibacter marinus]|uniref:Transcriptional regulator MraZ n=1 Tax=Temperatibacter marinus TaxID=1456591 RepID=A0AA52EEZ5_9PROT|nr:hypothetical protein [Temperatibacter marinus]WND01585.1 hypothetical protein QGN29_08435 [Temperatibacter marinus]